MTFLVDLSLVAIVGAPVAIVGAILWKERRTSQTASPSLPETGTSSRWRFETSAEHGPGMEQENRPGWDPFQPRPRRPHNAAIDGAIPTYRTDDRNSGFPRQHWDPYAEEQSKSHRARAARRRPRRPARSDYYHLLGLDVGASDAQIEAAYRRVVAAYHPDKFFDNVEKRRKAEEVMKEVNAAIQVLRDPVRRAQYDAGL